MRLVVSFALMLVVTACGFEPDDGSWDLAVTDEVSRQCTITDRDIGDGPMMVTPGDGDFELAFENGAAHTCTSEGEAVDCDDVSTASSQGSGPTAYQILLDHAISGTFQSSGELLGYSESVWRCEGAGCGSAGWGTEPCTIELRFTATAP